MWCGSAKCRSRWTQSTGRCARLDLFVAIGTSGAVYPAAGFVAEARAYGLRTCEINLEAADNAQLFDEQRLGAGERDGSGVGRGAASEDDGPAGRMAGVPETVTVASAEATTHRPMASLLSRFVAGTLDSAPASAGSLS